MDDDREDAARDAAIVIVAILTVRSDARDRFHAFERIAASVMARHGGSIERTVTVRDDASAERFREIHIVRFPDREAFDAYRADEELIAAAHLRDEAVIATELFIGEDGPEYDGTS